MVPVFSFRNYCSLSSDFDRSPQKTGTFYTAVGWRIILRQINCGFSHVIAMYEHCARKKKIMDTKKRECGGSPQKEKNYGLQTDF